MAWGSFREWDIMSIQLVSASALAGNLSAAPVLAGASEAGGFSGLMGMLLAGAAKGDMTTTGFAPFPGDLTANMPESVLQAALAQPTVLAQTTALQEAALVAAAQAGASCVEQVASEGDLLSLTGSTDLSAALPEGETVSAQDGEETAIPLLGALSTPVEAPQARLMPEMRGRHAAAETTGMSSGQIALAGKDTEVLSPASANLAADAEDFVPVLRESLSHAQARNALQAGAAAGLANPGGTHQDVLKTPLSSSAWAREFGEKIVWMARNDQHLARLSLHPAHLGPLSVTLNLEADKAAAVFVAATQEARQAIEDALPRLREMLAAAGVALGQTDVSAQERQSGLFSERHAAPHALRHQHDKNATQGDEAAILEAHLSAETPSRLRQGVNMVDLFA
jgi:flagellar hook-length control protein FliK